MINWLEEVKKRENEIINMLGDWISINSVYDDSTIEEFAPFGKGVRKAFDFILDRGSKDGFRVLDDEGYACHIDFSEGDSIVGILGHVDVVPVGDGWSNNPFEGVIKDGYIYGRGVSDDKGPVVAAYFASKIIRDLKLPISKKIRMILGGDEERNWDCVNHYFKKYPHPDTGFTPDGYFPLVYGEKEIQTLSIVGRYKSDYIETFESGNAINSVPDVAKVLIIKDISRIKKEFNNFLVAKEVRGDIKDIDDKVELVVYGKSAHGSTPEEGLNAAVLMLEFLSLVIEDDIVKNLYKLFRYYDGKGLGIEFKDDKMGSLTINLGIVSFVGGEFRFLIDMRYPLEIDKEELFRKLTIKIEKECKDFVVEKLSNKKGIFLDLDSELIKTLYSSYMEQSGDKKTKPMVIGGGTYARATKNIVCFGMLFPDSLNTFHQVDERVKVDDIILATAIYAQALYELAK